VETQRWINQRHPQTLLFATYLLYFDAVFIGILAGLLGRNVVALAIGAASAAAGYGIANDRKWGYWLGVVVSALALVPYALALLSGVNILSGTPINLMFAIAQFALLVHPMSRNYQKIWFR
jgi:uncharacterized membrane protein (DUF2068 family)